MIIISFYQNCPGYNKLCAMCVGKICTSCYSSYLNKFKSCKKPKTQIKNCLVYTNEEKCKFCYLGYKLRKNKCEKITQRLCIDVNLNDLCLTCNNGLLINKDRTCTDKLCKKNCSICTRDKNLNEICSYCNKGFVKNYKGECVNNKIRRVWNNCWFTRKDGKCILCNFNYYSKFGRCVRSELMNIEMGVIKPEALKKIWGWEKSLMEISDWFSKLPF